MDNKKSKVVRLPMSNGEIPDIGINIKHYPLAGGWHLWVGKKEDGTYAIDLHRSHPGNPDVRGWFSVVMTNNLPLKLAAKLYPQPWIAQEARADGTIGTICPAVLVKTMKDGKVRRYVAIEHSERHMGKMAEISRKSWSNTEKNIALPEEVEMVFHDVGTTHKDTARMSGPNGEPIKLQVAVVKTKEGQHMPKLPKGVMWMTFKTYATKPDGAGKDALFNALMMELLE